MIRRQVPQINLAGLNILWHRNRFFSKPTEEFGLHNNFNKCCDYLITFSLFFFTNFPNYYFYLVQCLHKAIHFEVRENGGSYFEYSDFSHLHEILFFVDTASMKKMNSVRKFVEQVLFSFFKFRALFSNLDYLLNVI